MLPTILFKNNSIKMIDQRKLPNQEIYVICRNYKEAAHAISSMVIRGAPAIGVAGAYGVAIESQRTKIKSIKKFIKYMKQVCLTLANARPTAVNLSWAVKRMENRLVGNDSVKNMKQKLVREAIAIEKEDIEANKKLANFGIRFIPKYSNVLTYCNTGGLATAGVGTALGVCEFAHKKGRKIHVYACETRPFLQGLRLTSWELKRMKIPFTLITDNMAGILMKKKKIDLVIVGADRIAANGDTANKIGTYTLAVLANEHKIPFYVAAPFSTVDIYCKTGDFIPIEERSADEYFQWFMPKYRLKDIKVINPAFDVTPNKLIKAIITDKGIYRFPFCLLTKTGN